MRWYPFAEVVTDVTSKFNKIKASDFKTEGQYIIIDQGKEPIAGYTDRTDLVNFELRPIIIFGDHTRIFKFIESPIALGADGAKALRVNPKIADSLYVYYYLRSINIQAAGYSRHFKFLKETKIPIPFIDGKPNLDDQIRIAHLLGKVEGLIAQRKKNLQQLDDLIKSVFLQMFGDPVRNEKGWDKRELGTIFKVKHGFAFKSEYFMDSGYYVLLTPGNFYEEGGFRNRGARQKYYVGETSKEYILNKYDLLFAMTEQAPGLLGSPLIVPESHRYLHNQRLGLVCAKEPIQFLFLFHLFNQKTIRQIIHSKATGTKVRHTSPTKIESIVVGYPPIDLQNQFAAIVEKVEGIKSYNQQSLTELENLYGALSQKVFKGELDLSRVPITTEITISLGNETEEGVMSELEAKNLVKLSTPDIDQLKYLSEPYVRGKTLEQWLQEYFDQTETTSSFSAECFIGAARKKLLELNQDGLFEPEGIEETLLDLSPTDYDIVKNWIFRALSDGKVEQTRNQILIDGKPEFGNEIILRKVCLVFTE